LKPVERGLQRRRSENEHLTAWLRRLTRAKSNACAANCRGRQQGRPRSESA
jgi:hypothetical protein